MQDDTSEHPLAYLMTVDQTQNDFPEAMRLLRRHGDIAEGEIVKYENLEIELHPEVLSPFLTNTTMFFLRNIDLRDGASVLELGVGTGFILAAITNRYQDLELAGVDINAIAAELATRNLRRNKLHGDIYVGNLFDPIPKRYYDYILFNPPLLVINHELTSEPCLRKAIFDNKGMSIQRFFDVLPSRLHPKSIAYLIYTNRQNSNRNLVESERIMTLAAQSKLNCQIRASMPVGYETYSVYSLSSKTPN